MKLKYDSKLILSSKLNLQEEAALVQKAFLKVPNKLQRRFFLKVSLLTTKAEPEKGRAKQVGRPTN